MNFVNFHKQIPEAEQNYFKLFDIKHFRIINQLSNLCALDGNVIQNIWRYESYNTLMQSNVFIAVKDSNKVRIKVKLN